jgi:hypothetical protein
MKPFIPFLVNFVAAASLLAVSMRRLIGQGSHRWVLISVLPLVDAGVLAAYVFGEDTYRDNGTSRWQAYRSPGGALGGMFVASVALMAFCAALLAYSGQRGDSRLFRWSAFAGSVSSLFLITPTIMGFGLN